HYVTGSLYRPSQAKGRRPGILCPHGHWANGRFYDAGAEKAASQIKKGAETFTAGARYPLQARMVQLARMGCVVFHYDMVGYADSGPLPHRSGFGDVQAVLRLQNLMGLQTFNSIRAIDFLETLPDVDPKRIAVTGASGGGTQTFMLCALDPRPRVAFPAVMVSTAMQGGCVCENCCYLRPGINNIAIAALFAPKPMALSGADDWTIDIETKGLPELKSIYGLFGKADLVQAKCYPQFGHNYNQVSREMMYGWMNEHLTLGLDQPIRERDFQPVAPAKLSVFDAEHPRPRDALTLEQYRVHQDGLAQQQFSELLEAAERGKPSKKRGLAAYRRVVGVAAEVLLGSAREGTPKLNRVAKGRLAGGGRYETGTLTASGRGETIPWTLLKSDRKFSGSLVVWFDGHGKASLFDSAGVPVKAVARLLEAGHAVLSADVFLTGELVPAGKPVTSVATHGSFVGYTYGYNLPPLAHRVQDVLTTVAAHSQKLDSRRVHLVGTRGAGTWVLLARAVASTGKKSRGLTIADIGGFGFSRITKRSDPMLLPGALKYGGLGGLTALAAPSRLLVAGTRGTPKTELDPLRRIYAVSAGRLVMQADPLEFEEVAALILDD
ncbi:MAG: acetylxylan esterase, partial [Planctomycetaceae bacterium]